MLASSSFQGLPPVRLRALLASTFFTVTTNEVARTATPVIHGLITSKFGEIVARLSRQVMAISAASAEQRFLMLLVKLGARLGTPMGGSNKFELPLTRSQMAACLGLSPETLSRAITQAKIDGLVSFAGRRRVTIPNWQRLVQASPLGSYILAADRGAAIGF